MLTPLFNLVFSNLFSLFWEGFRRHTENLSTYRQVFFLKPLMAQIYTNALRGVETSHRIHGTHRISLRNFIYFFNQQIKLISQTSCPAQQNRLICVITLIFKTLSVKVCDVCVRQFFTQNPRKTQKSLHVLTRFFMYFLSH